MSTLADRLHELSTGREHRSKAAQLRDLAPDLERAIAAGVPRSVILDELRKAGILMTMATFNTTFQRIRQRTSSTPPPAIETDPKTEQSNSVENPHSPKIIDEIIRNPPDMNALAKLGRKNRQ